MGLIHAVSAAAMTCRGIGRRITCKPSDKSTTSPITSLNYDPFLSSCLSFHTFILEKRPFPTKPRFDFSSISIRKPDDAVCLFHLFLKMRLPPSLVDFTKWLRTIVRMKQYSVAFSLFHKMLELDAPVNDDTLNLAIDCLCILNRVDLGFAILGSFFKLGYEPPVIIFSTLIKGLFLGKKAVEAEKLFKKLLREKICEPDEMMFLTMINGLCEAGQTLVARDLLRDLEKGSRKLNIYAYKTVIVSFCKERMVDDALKLFSQLIEQGLCTIYRWKEVKDLLNEMAAHKISPDVVTFSILVDAYCKEGMVKEEDVLKTMMQIDVRPDMITYNALIDGYCLQGHMDKARKLFDSAVDSGLNPSIITYNFLMSGYCEKGNVDEAWRLFLEIHSKGLEPTVVTYSTMLEGLFREGRCDDAFKLFDEMQARQVSPDLHTYSIFFDGLDTNDHIEIFSFLFMLSDKGVSLFIWRYNSLLKEFCKDGELEMAINLLNELPSKGFLQPNVETFTILINALCQEGLTQEVKDLLVKMKKSGRLPDSVACNLFLRGFLGGNEHEEAIPLLEEMIRRGFLID